MRKIMTVALLALAAVALAPLGATATPPPGSSTYMAVDYDCMGPDGVLTVTAPSGTSFCAFDAAGIPVASGTVNGSTQVYSSNVGLDAGGMVLNVHVGNEVLLVGPENGYSDWWW